MKNNLLLAVLFIIPSVIFSQSNSDNWLFGVNAGISFPGPTAITTGAMNTTEGCSAISDATGSLLFYTDGVSVWNKSNAVMPNGTGLMGNVSSTQSALIVPQPGSATLYYIFTVDADGGPNGFRYSIVDISLQSGFGDVTVKNTGVLDSVTEKLTAFQKNPGGEYWIAVHKWASDAFYLYTLSAAGFQTTPVISHAGIVHTDAQIQNTYGQMKFNPCGDKLACAIGYLNTIEVFEFDNASGTVSNPVTIPMPDHVYGIEFSQNSNQLYASCYSPNSTLVQFDLSSWNSATVTASLTPLSITADIYGLQIANNGKIYVCRSFSSFLGVINSPTTPGPSCNYVDNGVDLDPNFLGVTSGLSLPGFVQSTFRTEGGCIISGFDNPRNENNISVYPNPSSSGFIFRCESSASQNTLTVFDDAGRIAEQHTGLLPGKNYEIGSSLSAGIYYIRLSGNENVQRVVKF